MRHPVGLEEIEPDRWVAWVFDLVGCHGCGSSRTAALAALPDAVRAQRRLLAAETPGPGPPDVAVEFVVAEEHEAWISEGDYLVNAFFEDDRRPLSDAEVRDARVRLAHSRRDLLDAVRPLGAGHLDRPITDEARGTMRGVLRHVATAEWWYLDKLGLAFERDEMPADTLEALETVRGHLLRELPRLVGRDDTTTFRGERWSARKILRRALWHEAAHTRQIRRYARGG